MSQFKNILVGVDLSQTEPVGSTHFRPAARSAIDHAIWLAKTNKATLTCFSAVEVPDHSAYLAEVDQERLNEHLEKGAHRALAEVTKEAQAQGVAADSRLAYGAGWMEIIREVLRGGHDMVVVGTRSLKGINRLLFGSTARKLLHACPCPVWVTHAGSQPHAKNILVSSDLSPVSQRVLDVALSLASDVEGQVHLLNAVDYPLDRLWTTGWGDEASNRYHARVQADAREGLARQLATARDQQAASQVETHVVEGVSGADIAILHFVEKHQIDLLVMGTMARGGLAGVFVGNTAERLMAEIPCSLLAVKPIDFQCPVALAPEYA